MFFNIRPMSSVAMPESRMFFTIMATCNLVSGDTPLEEYDLLRPLLSMAGAEQTRHRGANNFETRRFGLIISLVFWNVWEYEALGQEPKFLFIPEW